ncbi:MAG: hypothetical protein KDJ22_12090 [Candidatus Competibacteraceae bacterium]|nr:hypothetical protein [Candidatus Competibacteraceae bacterium]MCB1769806.1 hypothetical protein [Candidatus Competibacteraceae bacterium]MCP5134797.1 hypothetical protein [Gammaproteobacteria bacterium]HPE71985.1 hypothetical protein [Candidatus Competibacter sp.]
MQLQLAFLKSLFQRQQKLLGFPLALTVHHGIVGIPSKRMLWKVGGLSRNPRKFRETSFSTDFLAKLSIVRTKTGKFLTSIPVKSRLKKNKSGYQRIENRKDDRTGKIGGSGLPPLNSSRYQFQKNV